MKFEQPPVPEKLTQGETQKPKEEEQSAEIEQANIAHEYLQEFKHYQRLNESYQDILKSLDRLREEGLLNDDDPTIKKLENELKSISALMDGSQEYMKRLFDQLSDESKEKYLKPKESGTR